jgi:hypothetical protein
MAPYALLFVSPFYSGALLHSGAHSILTVYSVGDKETACFLFVLLCAGVAALSIGVSNVVFCFFGSVLGVTISMLLLLMVIKGGFFCFFI